MSYDISLVEPTTRETIEFDTPHQMKGGTYALGGTSEAWLNITYNYARWYYKDGVFPNKGEDRGGIRSIYDMTGADSIPVLQHAISVLEEMTENLSEEEIREMRNKVQAVIGCLQEKMQSSRCISFWLWRKCDLTEYGRVIDE